MMATQDTTVMLKSTSASCLLAFVVSMPWLVSKPDVTKPDVTVKLKVNSHLLAVATCSNKLFCSFFAYGKKDPNR